MTFGGIVIKNLLRRKFRTLLTVLGVAVAIAAVVSLLGLSEGLKQTIADRMAGRGVDMIVLRAGVAQRLNSSLDESIGERLAAVPGVQKVALGLTEMVSFDGTSFIGVPIHGWPADSFAFNCLEVIDGNLFAVEQKSQVLLGQLLARELKKQVGDTLEIEGQTFNVCGIFRSSNRYDDNSAVVALVDLQCMMDRANQVTEFQLVLYRGEQSGTDQKQLIERVRNDIESMQDDQGQLLSLSAWPTEEFINKNTEIKMTAAMAWITSAIALLIGSVGMLNTMVMSVLERSQELGILRAIGWTKQRIVRMVLTEAIVLAMIGAVLGTLFAMLLTQFLGAFTPLASFVRSDFQPRIIVAGFGLAALVALVGGIFPAYRGASLAPTEALRYE
jgi:putative ABC transport system permease protein